MLLYKKRGGSVDDKTGQRQPAVSLEESGQYIWKRQYILVDKKSLSYNDRVIPGLDPGLGKFFF